jgi:hypothetical protein
METVVDSKQKPLPGPTVIIMAAQQLDLGGVPIFAAIASVAEELNSKNVDTAQVGNTVFVAHRGKGKNKNKMAGRSFNVDTAKNFVNNYVKYLSVLRNKGVTHYSVDFDGQALLSVVKAAAKRIRGAGMETMVGAFEDNSGYRVYVKLNPTKDKGK